jgi:tyrosinase
MKATAFLGAALAAAAVHAGVVPRETSGDGLTEPPALAELIEQAKAQVIDEVTENENKARKRGETPHCTLRNLVFRRE